MKISHWPRLLAAPLILAAVLLTGCAGGGPTATSWPGITVADQDIYLAYHKVYAIDSAGKMTWSFPPTLEGGQTFYAPPVVSDDMVIVTDYVDTVFAIDRATGNELWRFSTQLEPLFGLIPRHGSRYVGGAAAGEKYVYAASVDGVVHALNKSDGTQAWFFTADGQIWATPLLDGDTLYVVSLDRHVYALDAQTGDLQWKFPENPEDAGDPPMGPIVSAPTLHEGVLYFGSFNYYVYALDTTSRKILWSYQTTNWVWSSPVFDEKSGLLIGADLDGKIFALHPEDGSEAWTYNAKTGEAKSPIVGAPLLTTRADGTRVAVITVGAIGGPNLLVLNTEDGSTVVPPNSLQVTFPNNFLFIPLEPTHRVVAMYAPANVIENVLIAGANERDTQTYTMGDLLLIGAHEGPVQIYALNSESLDQAWEFNGTAEEEKAKAAAAPPNQGPFGGDTFITQILPIALLGAVIIMLLTQRRRPGGGR